MTFQVTSPVTGAVMTGFTAPTYTHVAGVSPDVNARQIVVTGLGGTQVGVAAHTNTQPFTNTIFVPKQFKSLGKAHPVTGVIADVPMNVTKVVTRKGVVPLAGQPFRTMVITTIVETPAGADVADSANVKAAVSMHCGTLTQQGPGLGDTLLNGVI
jgi:hypothetical protein